MTSLVLVALASIAAADRFGLVHGTAEVCADLGVGWTRFDFTWAGVERKPGEFDFSGIDAQLVEYEKYGVKVLPILDYGPAWDPEVSPADPEALDAWCRYVDTTVRRYKDRLTYWQVWNEPNLSDFWKPKPDAVAYAEFLERSYETIKRIDPNLKVIGFNCSDIDLKFTQTVIDRDGLDHCDLLAYQPYRIAPEAGHFEEMAALRELLAKHGAADKPIWFTEMGWASEHFPFSDAADLFAERPNRRQSAFLVRYMTLIMASGIERVFWFSQAADSHGLIDSKTGRKRMVFGVYQNFLNTVGDFTRVDEVIAHGYRDTYAYLFTCPNTCVLIAWSAAGEKKLPLKCLASAREVRDFAGKPIALRQHDSLVLSEEPIYVMFDSPPAELVARAAIRVPSGRIEVRPGESIDVPIAYRPADRNTPHSLRGTKPTIVSTGPRSIRPRPNRPGTLHITAPATAIPQTSGIRLTSRNFAHDVEIVVTPRTLWSFQGTNKGYVSPALYRGAAGAASILYGFWDAPELLCLSLDGKACWRYDSSTPLYGTPTLADLTGDGSDEIVIATPNDQTIHALDADGRLLWKTVLPGNPLKDKPQYYWTQPAARDLDGDGRTEIAFGDSNGFVHLLDRDGAVRWSRQVSSSPIAAPVIMGPVMPDMGPGILASSKDGWLYRIAPSGDSVLPLYLGSAVTSAPIELPRRSGLGPFIMLTTFSEVIQPLPCAAIPIWRADLHGTVNHGTGIGWANVYDDRGGGDEIVVSTRNNEVQVYSTSGELLKTHRTAAQLRCRPVAGDIDGDGENEILIGATDWKLYCFGKRPWTMNMGGRIDASPLLVDVNGDGALDIVQAVRGGKVVALSAK